MGYLTEVDIMDKLIDAVRIAAQAADDIAVRPAKGRTYRELRDALAEAESACRQMGHWRGQFQWFKLGSVMAAAHKHAGGWLRGVPYDVSLPNGGVVTRHRPLTLGEKHPFFVKLAENLRFCKSQAESLKNKATGTLGAVLPEVVHVGRPVGAPVSVVLPPGMIKTSGGLIVPQGMASQ